MYKGLQKETDDMDSFPDPGVIMHLRINNGTGLDIAKSIFHLYSRDAGSKVVKK
jgi:hypothetical protein